MPVLTAPPAARPAHVAPAPAPTWIRLPTRGRCPYTGLHRGKIYELIKTDAIRSAVVRSPGRKEGTRVVLLSSLLAFIEAQATGPTAPTVDSLPE